MSARVASEVEHLVETNEVGALISAFHLVRLKPLA
jgi:hypothetical protein